MVDIYKDVITEDTIVVTIVPMQQQNGTLDCGLFSIAAAFNVAMGRSISSITFEQSLMRGHLEKCFIAGKFSSFPTSKSKVKKCPCTVVRINVYCMCQKIKSYDRQMIQCDTCQKWYHFKCVNLSEYDSLHWHCPRCAKATEDISEVSGIYIIMC